MPTTQYDGTQVGQDGRRHTLASPLLDVRANGDIFANASSGASEAIDTQVHVTDLTLSANCTLTFVNPLPPGYKSHFHLMLRSGISEEVQLLTEGGTGLTSFTISYAGQTTTSIPQGSVNTVVQAALIALSNLAPGDVVVTGNGPYTLTFGGTLADTNVAAVTTTPTGGTGTMLVTTPTPGGATNFTPTWPGSVDWPDATPPTFATPALYEFVSVDAGTTWLGKQIGKAFA